METQKHTIALFTLIPAFLCIFSCETEERDFKVKGMRPVYAESEWQQISFGPARPIAQLGKLAMKNGYLFVNERMKGIHIIDNRNPEDPETIGFVNIPGNTDFDFKGDVLYVDNFSDLVAIRMLPDFSIEITDRKQNLYKSDIPAYPAHHTGYFECADPAKGFVIDWIEADLNNPKCRR